MKIKFNIYVILGILVILILTNQYSNGNWLMSVNDITYDPQGMKTQNTPNTQHTFHLKSDSLPEGFTDELMKDLRDENGNKIIPEDEGDAFQQRTFNGSAANDSYGYSVSSAGDVNNDGYDDIIIGAPYNAAAGSDAGRAYIYFGGINVNSIADVILTGEAAGIYFGISVSDAGDVNGDGYSDVIVGAYGYNSSSGRAYIYYGNTLMNNVADVILTGAAANYYFGLSVSDAGDVNGDGYSDVLVGAYGYSSFTGRAYIYYGGSTMDNVIDVTFTGESTNNYFGLSVSSAGDLNGDGYSDIVIGAKRYTSYTGRAYVYFGSTSMDNTADLTITGEATSNFFGESVSTAEDVNGDGYSDLIIGASSYGGGNGRVYLYYGGSDMDNSSDVTFTGTTLTNFGNSVSNAGDVNGDGYSDVIIGEKNAYNSATGRAYVYFGGAAMNNTADLTMTGEASSNYFGASVSDAGDVNGDGYSDVTSGAYGFNSNTGRSYLYMYGMKGTFSADITVTGAAILREIGASVSTAGDVNGDGFDDVIIGAPYSAGAGFGGDAYIYFGGAVMDNIADVSLGGEAANNRFGTSVSTAGDVNGDGYSDVIVGAYAYSSQRGRAYIYYGGASMNNVADVIMTGDAPSYYFGISVSSAGDVNADGYADVIIGADAYNVSTGLAYIYLGGAGMNNVADVTMIGEDVYNYFGHSVSSAGDVNADGYADIAVGAYGNNTNKGKVYVYFGGGSMDNVAEVTMTGLTADEKLGNSVSSAGDVNGDGYSDILTGAFGYSNNSGRAYIFYGGFTMDSYFDVTMSSEVSTIFFGNSVSAAGDINKDGFSDVIVGTYESTGLAYIFYGSASMNGTADVYLTSEGVNTYFGKSVSSAGDLNGDGNTDLIIGAPQTNSLTGRTFIYLTSTPDVHPNILSVKDVPDDQGGYVNLKFARSAFDVPLSETGGINYQIERSIPPNISGYNWISAATVMGTRKPVYTAEVHTPLDSSSSGNNTYFFRITAISNSSGSIWRSNILSGYSIDNLAPLPPENLAAAQSGSNINLNWNQNSENDLRQYIIYRNGSQIGTSLTLNFSDNLFSPDSSFIYRISAEDIHGNISGLSGPANINLTYSTIIIKVIPEGFYNTSAEQLNLQDTVRAYLHLKISPYNTIDSAISEVDPVSFTGSFKFFNAPNGTYYIVIKHRNTIQTWSKSGGEPFSSATIMNYDFTSASTQAFGNNLVQADASPLRYAIYSGDVNQDGFIDLSDVIVTYNEASSFVTGYNSSDVNGDNITDLNDLLFAYNNSVKFVCVIKP